MIHKEVKETIERLCRIFINSLPGKNALDDSIALKNYLNSAFPNDMIERMYAYRCCSNMIKEKTHGKETENNNYQREGGVGQELSGTSSEGIS